MTAPGTAIFWFRRDLRLHDNAGLYKALKENTAVLPIFIFDTDILDLLENKNDKRVEFIHLAVTSLKEELESFGSSLLVLYGQPSEIFKKVIKKYSVTRVYTNRDYEPYASVRDAQATKCLSENNVEFKTYKDQVIFERSEITKDDGLPYTVFTPYMRKWKSRLNAYALLSYASENYFSSFIKLNPLPVITLEEMGFKPSGQPFSVPEINSELIAAYNETRNFPAIEGTSRLSVHLRFGTLSIRKAAAIAQKLNEQWLNGLIWREFYMMIIFHFPHAAKSAFKKKYERIPWRNNEKEFDAWCRGKTGYPIVDAGMRQLNETGFMHNRVRMITASFLVKHLLIDWRWGEAYFAEKLMDFDLSANNGGWQWAAGSGCDAAPYFRVFNPYEQAKRFDPASEYIRKWLPEFETPNYTQPIVEHRTARDRVLAVYKKALANNPE